MNTGKSSILIINGSLRGKSGNTAVVAEKAAAIIRSHPDVSATVLTLTDPMPDIATVMSLVSAHNGLLVLSGIYWNNWSSPLQRFIEVATAFEQTPVFFGKPVACAVSMDSVGGMEVAGRLHAAFSGLGCWSPPCSTLVISRVGQEAINHSADTQNNPNEDVWQLDDLETVIENLVIATRIKTLWKSWPHVGYKIDNNPWPETGTLDLGSPKYL